MIFLQNRQRTVCTPAKCMMGQHLCVLYSKIILCSSLLVKLVIQFFKTSTKLYDVKENDWDLRFVDHSKSVERSREIDLVFERLNWF